MTNNNGNILYELARAMRGQGGCLTAMALRVLAQHGYTSLAEVEGVTDCELLAIGGIGPDRLGAIRQLTQPDWQPPSRRAIRTASQLLSTAQLALRFWSIEDLEATLGRARPVAAGAKPVEARLSLEAFAGAAREAAAHHDPDELLRIVQRAGVLRSPKGCFAYTASPQRGLATRGAVTDHDEKTRGLYDQP